MFFTIGQRQGIKIGGIKDTDESPWYVLDKNLDTNELIIGQGNSNPKLYTKLLFATDINWINESLRSIDEFKCHADGVSCIAFANNKLFSGSFGH